MIGSNKNGRGYSKAEKKSVLQKIIDFFDRIIEAIRQTIKEGDLSETAREFSQMQKDKAAEIRKMFLDALDGIDGKKKKNAGEETKNSRKRSDFDETIDKNRGKAHNKRRLYNESDTLFMKWSNSPSVPVGELKVFKRGKEWALFKKTKDGCVEMYRGEYKKEVLNYGQTYAETDTSYNEDIEEIGLDTGRDLRNLLGIRDKENAGRHGRPTESEGLQTDSEGNNEHLRTGVRRISDITDSKVKNSLKRTDSEEKKNSLRHSLGITNEGNADSSLLSQNEEYRKLISELQTQLGKRHFVDAKKVRTLARVIKVVYRSTITTDELTDMLSISNTTGNAAPVFLQTVRRFIPKQSVSPSVPYIPEPPCCRKRPLWSGQRERRMPSARKRLPSRHSLPRLRKNAEQFRKVPTPNTQKPSAPE